MPQFDPNMSTTTFKPFETRSKTPQRGSNVSTIPHRQRHLREDTHEVEIPTVGTLASSPLPRWSSSPQQGQCCPWCSAYMNFCMAEHTFGPCIGRGWAGRRNKGRGWSHRNRGYSSCGKGSTDSERKSNRNNTKAFG